MLITTSLGHGMAIANATPYESAKMMKQAGFDGIDLPMDYNYESGLRPSDADWEADILAKANAAKEAGLVIGQCHLPSYPGHIDAPGDGDYMEYENLMLPDYVRALEICGKIDCKVAVMHPFFTLDSVRGSVNGNIKTLQKLMGQAERLGVAIALENVYAHRSNMFVHCAVQHAEIIEEIIERMNTPLVGACLDTGHANIFHYDISDMAKVYGKHLIALHVNSNSGTDEHLLPNACPGWCEKQDFHRFSRTLHEIGYAGNYNLEISCGARIPSAALPFYRYAAEVARGFADEVC